MSPLSKVMGNTSVNNKTMSPCHDLQNQKENNQNFYANNNDDLWKETSFPHHSQQCRERLLTCLCIIFTRFTASFINSVVVECDNNALVAMETLLKYEQVRQDNEFRRRFQFQQLARKQPSTTTARYHPKYSSNSPQLTSPPPKLTHAYCDVATPTNYPPPLNYLNNDNRYPLPSLQRVTMETSYYHQEYGYQHHQPWVNPSYDQGYGSHQNSTGYLRHV